jgi:FkbM family methyltransferase
MRFFTNLLGKAVAPFIGTGIGTLPLVIPAWHLIWKVFGTTESQLVDVQGFKMYTDPKDFAISPQLLSKGCWEPFETEVFKGLIKQGMMVVDIGANIGYYSLLASTLVGKSGKVYAFEPFGATCDIMARSIAINGMQNVTLIRKAVTIEVGTTQLYFGKYTPACNNLNGKGEFVTISCTTLDHELKGCKVDLIKMDIEGSEAKALVGMQGIIRDNPKLILVTEVFPEALKEAGSSVEAYVTALLKWFDVRVIEEKKHRLTPCKSLEQVLRFMSGKMLLNLVCNRKPK